MTNKKTAAKQSPHLLDAFSKELLQHIRDKGGVENVDSEGILKELVSRHYQTLLNAELEEHLGYPPHAAKNTGNSRNGSSTKKVRTELGEIDLETPRDRNGTFEPQAVKKRQTTATDFTEKIISLYTRGLTTREIEEHLQEMYGIEVSPTFVSRATEAVLAEVKEWQSRPLESVYPVIYMDGIFFSVRDNGRIKKKCVYVCLGISMEGTQDVLGFWIADTESASFWVTALNGLKSRGVEDILIACIDGLSGLTEAIASVYPKADIQLCVVHQIRNSTKHIYWKDRKAFCKDLKSVYTAPDEEAALLALEHLEKTWGTRYPAAVQNWQRDWDKLVTFMAYPPELRKFIYTTNSIESLNSVLRKNTRNRKVFPSDEALLKILYLNIRKHTRKWGKRHQWGMIYNQLVILFKERIALS